jgi:hypothetical protein
MRDRTSGLTCGGAHWKRWRISYNLFDKPSGSAAPEPARVAKRSGDVGNLLENVVF